ncbi:hypothetical protein HDG34_002511 [Paraburkholderia sp. HC6.4b]|uniref:hypothetical protein n=1 Tax=unclassified Paraburkholderia TaxID=2615204 RepID=UPI00160A94A9|nr:MULTISPECIES: hypothetical protein [unclassified Paraburkholderia]MBB5408574.1 hypothetical protein [Paraburkholderia sp. HC6.4b]MBB5450406.1 hypothetical protein [Paraburkholderia sp. Kb1A]
MRTIDAGIKPALFQWLIIWGEENILHLLSKMSLYIFRSTLRRRVKIVNKFAFDHRAPLTYRAALRTIPRALRRAWWRQRYAYSDPRVPISRMYGVRGVPINRISHEASNEHRSGQG